MPITQADLQDFNRFADDQLRHGGADSLVDLAGRWEAQRDQRRQREAEETMADLRESHADIEAGRVQPVTEAFAEIRKQLGLA